MDEANKTEIAKALETASMLLTSCAAKIDAIMKTAVHHLHHSTELLKTSCVYLFIHFAYS